MYLHRQVFDAANEIIGAAFHRADHFNMSKAFEDFLHKSAGAIRPIGCPHRCTGNQMQHAHAHWAGQSPARRHCRKPMRHDCQINTTITFSPSRMSPRKARHLPSQRICITGVCQRIISDTIEGDKRVGLAASVGKLVQRQNTATDANARCVIAADNQQQDIAEKQGRVFIHFCCFPDCESAWKSNQIAVVPAPALPTGRKICPPH